MEEDAPSSAAPARRFGAPRDAGVPRMEHARVTAPDLQRRAALERTRGRLVFAAGGFVLLFGAVTAKLVDATVWRPAASKPSAVLRRPEPPPMAAAIDLAHPSLIPVSAAMNAGGDAMPHARRAMITDRNGEILAISLPTAGVFADPREMIDTAEAAHRLKSVLPQLDEAAVRNRLADARKQFVYIARQVTPRQELAINALGIPGIQFLPTERRRYPLGRMAAQVLGGVDVDSQGVAGVEKQFEQRLLADGAPLRLSLDVRVQAVVRDELSQAMKQFKAIGACGIVMDVRSGEVLAMVSLPDYDANLFGEAKPDDRFNRAITGVYEPGSTFKLQTASMALDDGVVNIWNGFDATNPIRIGRFTISDFEGKHRFLYLPEILAYSSNIGAAKMAEAVGGERQRAWLKKMGMLDKVGIELPEVGRPLFPPAANWKAVSTLTIGFGHGIAVTPLQVVAGTAAVANGGTLFRPTILAPDPDAASPDTHDGKRVMRTATSDIIRRLMRLVVTDGYGKPADVPGYFVGGKTGTAEKISYKHYNHNSRVSAFMSAFPMNAPHYAVYMMLDEPQANASTHGFATAGWVSAPAAGRVIARIGPMLGLLPETDNAATIQAALSIPMEPVRPSGARAALPAATIQASSKAPAKSLPIPDQPRAAPQPVTLHDLRHEATWRVPAVAGR